MLQGSVIQFRISQAENNIGIYEVFRFEFSDFSFFRSFFQIFQIFQSFRYALADTSTEISKAFSPEEKVSIRVELVLHLLHDVKSNANIGHRFLGSLSGRGVAAVTTLLIGLVLGCSSDAHSESDFLSLSMSSSCIRSWVRIQTSFS